MAKPAHLLGKWGERFAAQYLQRKGFAILAKNWRGSVAEIDLIAESNMTIIFCEVKTRVSTAYGHPAEAVNANRIIRMRAAAENWPNPARKQIRLDVISICLQPRIQIEHFEGVGL